MAGVKELVFNKEIPRYRLVMEQPDGSILDFEVATLLLFINNGKYGGGHTNFTPGAIMNDGLLDVMLKTGDFGIKSGLKILDEAKKKCGKHVFRDDIHNFRAKNIKIFNLNFEKTKKVKKAKGDKTLANPEEI